MTLELEWQKAEQERQEDTHQHEPLSKSNFAFIIKCSRAMWMQCRKICDPDYIGRSLREFSFLTIWQNFRYHCIVCLSMVSRFCIEGGMPGEQAYRMSDFYIRKIDTATTIDQVEKLHDAARDYVKRMQQRKIKQVCSKPVSPCPEP